MSHIAYAFRNLRTPTRLGRIVVPATVVAALVVSAGTAATAVARETAVAAERNPPGDIPDDQVFVTYASPRGFALKVPEGWSRTDRPNGVRFYDKYGSIDVDVAEAPAPTVGGVRAADVPALEREAGSVKVSAVKAVDLPSGGAVRIAYTSNSEPNAVTGKRIRLENERTLIPRGGLVARLTFAAPAGSDNVDQWKLMADSFRWR